MFSTPKLKSIYDSNLPTIEYNANIAKVLFDSNHKAASGSLQYGGQSISIVFPVIRDNDIKDITSLELLNTIMAALDT